MPVKACVFDAYGTLFDVAAAAREAAQEPGNEALAEQTSDKDGKAMFNLAKGKLDQALTQAYQDRKPILGICLGTQIIMEWSEENRTPCLGLIKGTVRRFPEEVSDKRLKVPHMGWNGIMLKRKHPLFQGVEPSAEFYFVHSYALPVTENTIASCDYGKPFTAAVNKDNFYGVQFHPERSGKAGAQLIKNFLEL